MVQVNGNYLKLKAGYLFPEIGRRVKAFSEANPTAPIIRLGIGDVTEPLPEACRSLQILHMPTMKNIENAVRHNDRPSCIVRPFAQLLNWNYFISSNFHEFSSS